jgi:hypothetical protein
MTEAVACGPTHTVTSVSGVDTVFMGVRLKDRRS